MYTNSEATRSNFVRVNVIVIIFLLPFLFLFFSSRSRCASRARARQSTSRRALDHARGSPKPSTMISRFRATSKKQSLPRSNDATRRRQCLRTNKFTRIIDKGMMTYLVKRSEKKYRNLILIALQIYILFIS